MPLSLHVNRFLVPTRELAQQIEKVMQALGVKIYVVWVVLVSITICESFPFTLKTCQVHYHGFK